MNLLVVEGKYVVAMRIDEIAGSGGLAVEYVGISVRTRLDCLVPSGMLDICICFASRARDRS